MIRDDFFGDFARSTDRDWSKISTEIYACSKKVVLKQDFYKLLNNRSFASATSCTSLTASRRNLYGATSSGFS